MHGNFNLDQHLREQEGYYIAAALELAYGNISEAARLLGINRTTCTAAWVRMRNSTNKTRYGNLG